MTLEDGGHPFNETARLEHHVDSRTKKVLLVGFTGTEFVFVKVDASGRVDTTATLAGVVGLNAASVPTLFAVVNTSAGGFNEDSPHTTGDLGTQVLSVRRDTLGSLVSAENDYASLLSDSAGQLWVHPGTVPTLNAVVGGNVGVSGIVSFTGATQYPWGYSGGTIGDIGTLVFGVRNDALTHVLSAANKALQPFSMDSVGRLRVNPSYSAAESASHAVGDTLVNIIAGIRQDSDSARTDLTNETALFLFNDKQHLRVSVQGTTDHDAVDAGRGIKLGGRARTAEPSAVANNDFVDAYFDEFGYLKVKVGNLSPNVEGDKADDAVDGGNPVKIGGRVFTALRVPLPAADRVNGCFDGYGRLVVETSSPDDQTHQANTLSTGSTDTGLVAPVAGSLTVVKSILASNTSATKVRLDLKDGTTTKISMALAADGGGFTHEFSKGWPLSSGATLTAQISASVTDVRVNLGYIRKPY